MYIQKKRTQKEGKNRWAGQGTYSYGVPHCSTLQHTATKEVHKEPPDGREDRAIEGTNTVRVRAVGALHAHAVTRHEDGVLCAVVATSRRLVVPKIHSKGIEMRYTIRHTLYAAKRIATHCKIPVHKTRARYREIKKMRHREK